MTRPKGSGRRGRRWIVLLVLLALLLPGLDQGLKVRTYTVEAPGLDAPVRLVLLTDLHSCKYGEGEAELIAAVAALTPDLVLLGGDIFDDVLPDGNTEALLRGVAALCPCCYVTGNHEFVSGAAVFLERQALLDQCGIRSLAGDCVTAEVRGQAILLCGVDDPLVSRLPSSLGREDFARQLKRAAAESGTSGGGFTILLAHRPEYVETYRALGFSLVLCGHAHGGQWRIPGLVNGLYAPNQGLFPPYAGGQYRVGGTTMIVSRGLARESTRIPRFYNPPEVVAVELVPAPS